MYALNFFPFNSVARFTVSVHILFYDFYLIMLMFLLNLQWLVYCFMLFVGLPCCRCLDFCIEYVLLEFFDNWTAPFAYPMPVSVLSASFRCVMAILFYVAVLMMDFRLSHFFLKMGSRWRFIHMIIYFPL